MSKPSKDKNQVYKSFEQFKAELFPKTIQTTANQLPQDINNLAVCLAETSFNKVLHPTPKA